MLALPARAPPAVFERVLWSCERTLASQVERLAACGLRTERGATYDDVDEMADVRALADRIEADGDVARQCPAVTRALGGLKLQLDAWAPSKVAVAPPAAAERQ